MSSPSDSFWKERMCMQLIPGPLFSQEGLGPRLRSNRKQFPPLIYRPRSSLLDPYTRVLYILAHSLIMWDIIVISCNLFVISL